MAAGVIGETTETPRRNSLPYLYWGVLIALFALEVLSISFVFDVRTVRAVAGWHQLIKHAGWGVRAGLEVALGVVIVAGPTWYRELKARTEGLTRRRASWAIAGNLLAYAAFFGCSSVLLAGDGLSRPDAPALAAAWAILGLASAVFWALAVLPWDLWIRLGKVSSGAISLGALMGAVAYIVAVFARDRWYTLAAYTLNLTHFLLKPLFPDIVCDPAQYMLSTTKFHVEIAPVCSGYEGMAWIVVLMICYLFLCRRELRLPRAFVLLPIGMALIWLSNSVRIAALFAIGNWGYEEIAVGGFHSLAGWAFFLIIGVGLMVAARRSKFFALDAVTAPDTVLDHDHDHDAARAGAAPAAANSTSTSTSDAAYLVPAMLIVAQNTARMRRVIAVPKYLR